MKKGKNFQAAGSCEQPLKTVIVSSCARIEISESDNQVQDDNEKTNNNNIATCNKFGVSLVVHIMYAFLMFFINSFGVIEINLKIARFARLGWPHFISMPSSFLSYFST